MAFELPTLPFPRDANNVPYIASPDAEGKYTVPVSPWFKNAAGIWRPVSADEPLPTSATINGSTVKQTSLGSDQSVSWANSDAANTQKTITITKPANVVGTYKVVVYNPSTVTDLTVKVFTVETSLGGADRDSFITSFSVPKAQAVTGTTVNTYEKMIEDMFNGGNARLVLSNDTVLGASDGFTAYVRVREVM